MIKRYYAGHYTTDVAIDVVKEMSFKSNKTLNGNVTKVYGVWCNDENIYKFRPGKTIKLTEEDLKNVNLRNMIDSGRIRRAL